MGSLAKIAKPSLAGALSAGLLNAAVFLVARSGGFFGGQVVAIAHSAPFSVGVIVATSVAGVFAAVALRLILGRVLVGGGRARSMFLGVSALGLLVSFASPFHGVAGATAVELWALCLMHVVVAIAAAAAAEWSVRPEWRFGEAPYEARSIDPRTALVTGATSGIGAQVALELRRRGFQVVGVGRSPEKARALEAATPGMKILTGDIGSIAGAAQLAAAANALVGSTGFGVVVHCAGTLKPTSSPNVDGVDSNFATSFLGRVALTRGLRLAPEWRLVNVAAAESGVVPAFMRMELRTPKDIGRGMRSHGQAQLANDLWAAQLARTGVSAFGYGPGAVDTEIRRELPSYVTAIMKPIFAVDTRSPREAALDIVRLLLDRSLPDGGFAGREGVFRHDMFILDPVRQDALVRLCDTLLDRAAREAS